MTEIEKRLEEMEAEIERLKEELNRMMTLILNLQGD